MPTTTPPAIEPAKAADINKALASLDALTRAEGVDPVRTTRGSMTIDHADGTFTHMSYRRQLTTREAARADLAPVPRVRKSLIQRLMFWR